MDSYNTFEEKNEKFAENERIDTPEQFETMIQKLTDLRKKSKVRCVFRGICEAKYKLFTSLQREWLTMDMSTVSNGKTPSHYVECMISTLKDRNNALMKYFRALDVSVNDWLLLAFLQHYGAPSPLLDFSRDFIPALYFMCLGMKQDYSNNPIDHYASLVYYQTVEICANGYEKLGTTAWNSWDVNGRPNLKKVVDRDKFVEQHLSFGKVMANKDIEVITSDEGKTQIKKSKESYVTSFPIGNLNMVSQTGEFVCNLSEDKPLEDLFVSRKGIPLIHCFNIHKSLFEYIIDKYFDGSIEKTTPALFPTEYMLAQETRTKALRTIFTNANNEPQEDVDR